MDVVTDEVYSIPESTLEQVSYEGEGLKNIVLVVEKNHYGEAEAATLQLIIKAIKLDFVKDVILLKPNKNQKISLTSLIPDYQDILIFGLKPADLGFFIEYKSYEVLKFETKRMLVSDSLTELNISKQKKGLLWSKLQTMYQV
jgi:hypothetical protein